MARIDKTEKNLRKIWNDLDIAHSLLFNTLDDLCKMSGLSEDIKTSIEIIDTSAIAVLKNRIADLIENFE